MNVSKPNPDKTLTNSALVVDWDHSGPLNDSQIDLFLALEEVAVNPFYVFGVDSETVTDSYDRDSRVDLMDSVADHLDAFSKSKLIPTPLPKSSPLYIHLNALESNVHAVKELKQHLSGTASKIDQLDGLTDRLQAADNTMREATDRLIREKGEIDRIAGEIETHLDNFSFLEEFAAWVSQSPLPLEDPTSVSAILSRADECLIFMTNNAHFTDTVLYGTRFRSCMTRAITGIRNYVVATLRDKGTLIANTAASTVDLDAIEYESVSAREAALAILAAAHTSSWAQDLRTLCHQLAPVVAELVARCPAHPEYHALRAECVHTYLSVRWQAVGPVADQLIACVKRLEGHLVDQVGLATSNITVLVDEEIVVFSVLFNDQYVSDLQCVFETAFHARFFNIVLPLFDNIYLPFYNNLRPKILGESNLQTLARVCSALMPRPTAGLVSVPGTPVLESLLVDAQHRLVFRSQHQMNTMFTKRAAYTPEIRQSVCLVLHCLSGSVGFRVVQVLAEEWVPLLLQRILDSVQPIPPSATTQMLRSSTSMSPHLDHGSETSGLLRSTTTPDIGSTHLDASLIEIQLFRVHELATVLDAVRQVPALTDTAPAREMRGASVDDLLAVANNVRNVSGGSLFESVLGRPSTPLKGRVSNASPDKSEHDGTGEPVSVVRQVEATLMRARDDFLLDCVHSCTYQLKRWLVRAASVGTIDSSMAWASIDAVFQLARDWHTSAEAEIKNTLVHVQVYLSGHTSARTMVLRPLVDSIAVVYRDFIHQVSRVHGEVVMNGFMSSEACVHWLNQAISV